MRRSIEVTEALRTRLANAASRAGLDERALARRARLSHRVVRDVLSGRRTRIDLSTHDALCRALKLPPESVPRGSATPVAPAAHAAPAARRRRLAAIAIAATLVAVLIIARAARREFTPTLGIVSDERWVTVVDSASGAVAWQVEHNSRVRGVRLTRGPQSAVVLYGLETPEEHLLYARDARSGDILWGYRPDHAMFTRVFGKDVIGTGDFGTRRIRVRDLDGDGRREIIAIFHHTPWYPGAIVFIADDGRVTGTYYTCGSIEDVAFFDTDGDGREEALVFATNNARAYQGGMIAVLDAAGGDGASIDSLAARTHFAPGCPLEDTARARVIFPAFEPAFMERLGGVRLMVARVECRRENGELRVIADVGVGVGVGVNGENVRVTLDGALEPVQVEALPGLRRRVSAWPADERERFLGGYLDEWARTRVHLGEPRVDGRAM